MENVVNYMSEANYKELSARYVAFHDALGDSAQPVVRVYETLSPRLLQEMQLVRGISRELQKRKQDDMKKAGEK